MDKELDGLMNCIDDHSDMLSLINFVIFSL